MKQAVRDALIAFMAATAQAQAEATKEAQRAGIEHAKANGESCRRRKPSYTRGAASGCAARPCRRASPVPVAVAIQG
jgi:DNA invertase Pin-like site-specific DNA recombinase